MRNPIDEAAPDNTGQEQGTQAARPAPGPPVEHRFKPGRSGNPAGRPKSARSRLTEDFLTAVAQQFEESGVQALQTLAAEKPAEFLRIAATLLPKHLETTGADGEAVGVASPVLVTSERITALLDEAAPGPAAETEGR